MLAFCSAIGTGAAILTAVVVAIVAFRPAQANPQFAAETKLPCTQCHTSAPFTAGNLTDFGKKFHDNGNKVPN
jgi:hypothetical protein